MAEGIGFERLLVITNPVSRRAYLTQQYLEHLREARGLGSRLLEVPTRSGGIPQTVDLINKHIKPGYVLGVLAGDGTVNLILEALFHRATDSSIRNTPILPLWGGSANDIANSLNSRRLQNRPDEILARGREVAIRPLRCQLLGPGLNHEYIAAGYAGFGLTALAATQINKRRGELRLKSPEENNHSATRVDRAKLFARGWVSDLGAVATSLTDAKAFRTRGDASGRQLEVLFNNGPRMAKALRPRVDLSEPEWRAVVIPDRIFTGVIPAGARMLIGMAVGGLLRADEPDPAHFSFRALDAIPAQFDGETRQIAAGTTINVDLHPGKFNAITTK